MLQATPNGAQLEKLIIQKAEAATILQRPPPATAVHSCFCQLTQRGSAVKRLKREVKKEIVTGDSQENNDVPRTTSNSPTPKKKGLRNQTTLLQLMLGSMRCRDLWPLVDQTMPKTFIYTSCACPQMLLGPIGCSQGVVWVAGVSGLRVSGCFHKAAVGRSNHVTPSSQHLTLSTPPSISPPSVWTCGPN